MSNMEFDAERTARMKATYQNHLRCVKEKLCADVLNRAFKASDYAVLEAKVLAMNGNAIEKAFKDAVTNGVGLVDGDGFAAKPTMIFKAKDRYVTDTEKQSFWSDRPYEAPARGEDTSFWANLAKADPLVSPGHNHSIDALTHAHQVTDPGHCHTLTPPVQYRTQASSIRLEDIDFVLKHCLRGRMVVVDEHDNPILVTNEVICEIAKKNTAARMQPPTARDNEAEPCYCTGCVTGACGCSHAGPADLTESIYKDLVKQQNAPKERPRHEVIRELAMKAEAAKNAKPVVKPAPKGIVAWL